MNSNQALQSVLVKSLLSTVSDKGALLYCESM